MLAQRFDEQRASIVDHSPMPDWYRDWVMAVFIPRGGPDSWRKLRPGNIHGFVFDFWTSLKAARYHFIPDFPDNDLAHPVWRINGTIDDEGYTPPDTKYYALPAQLARFRQDDTTVVAVSGDLAGSALAGNATATAHLVLSNGPGSFPVHLTSSFHDGRAVFLAPAPAGRYVASYEVLAPGEVGRHRVMVEPLDAEGPGVSDLLLYQPIGDLEPDSLRMAAAMMLGTDTVEAGDQLGVYWETYGADKDTPVQVELEVRKEGGGLIATLKRLLPGGGTEGPGRLSWNEPSKGEVFPRAVVLDLEGLGSGTYTLAVRTSWAGQKALETQRMFVVR
jgi:hypothetical protein